MHLSQFQQVSLKRKKIKYHVIPSPNSFLLKLGYVNCMTMMTLNFQGVAIGQAMILYTRVARGRVAPHVKKNCIFPFNLFFFLDVKLVLCKLKEQCNSTQ